jgi:hypothetical protein
MLSLFGFPHLVCLAAATGLALRYSNLSNSQLYWASRGLAAS